MEDMMTFIQPFFDWLLQTTLIGSVVICLILLIQKILGGRLGPRWCHALWLVLLIRMILPWAPSSRISLFNLIPSWDRQIQPQQLSEATRQQEVSQTSQTSDSTDAIPADESESVAEIQEQATAKPGTLVDMHKESQQKLASLRRALPILWLAGAIVVGAYILVSDFALWRIVKRDHPLVNQEMLELFEECKAQMDVQSLVVVVPSDQVRSPGLFGFVRPRLLLPREMLDNASREEMRYVFLHELAHLKRRDIYLGWLTSLLQILHWFNPLVWFAFYRMRTDRELACDALVLTRTGQEKSHEYGGAIVGLLRRFSRSRRLPALAGIIENRSQLKRRITMITQFKKNSYKWSPLAVMLIVVFSCISLPDARDTKTPETSATTPTNDTTLRQIWSGRDSHALGAVSADGRYLTYVDWETGDLAIRELETGKKRRLTKEATWNKPMAFALNSTISADSELVAYSWMNQFGTYDLCLVGIDSLDSHTLFSNKDYEAYPHEFSSDGEYIATFLFRPKDGNCQIVWISVADGSVRVLKPTLKGHTTADCMCHSPDDRYIAYDLPIDDDSGRYDIYLLATDGNDEIPLIKHPANDKLLGWVPGGNEILFLSDRAGTHDLWMIQVRNGRPQGSPRRIKSSIGQIYPIGITRNGYFYFDISSRLFTTYITTLDLETGKILAPLSQPFLGSSFQPEWSPDGESIAYIAEAIKHAGLGFFYDVLHVRSLTTGKDCEVSCELKRLSNPRWSPDGYSILVSGYDRNNKQDEYNGGLYKIDVKDGNVTNLMLYAAGTLGTGEWGSITGEWSPDGKAIFYVNRKSILKRQLESSQETQLYSDPNLVKLLALSPDGQKIVFGLDDPEKASKCLMIISASGENPHELLKLEESGSIKAITWTRDGKYVLFTKKEQEATSLWRIATQGGIPRKLWESGKDLRGLRIHPDGQQLAFYELTKNSEIWLIENFLPESAVGK